MAEKKDRGEISALKVNVATKADFVIFFFKWAIHFVVSFWLDFSSNIIKIQKLLDFSLQGFFNYPSTSVMSINCLINPPIIFYLSVFIFAKNVFTSQQVPSHFPYMAIGKKEKEMHTFKLNKP